MRRNIIYALRDPRTDEYRYIGKSTSGIERARSHLTFSHNQDVNLWVLELRSFKSAPEIDILEECFEDELSKKERNWISHFTSAGCRLFNSIQYKGEALERLQEEIAEERRLLELELGGIRKSRIEIATIGGSLKARRKILGLKQSDLAKLAGISIRTLQHIERNEGNPTIDIIKKCLDIVGFSLYPGLKNLP